MAKDVAADQPREKLDIRPGDAEMPFAQLTRIGVFAGLSKKAESKLKGKGGDRAVVLRRFRKGDIICRQGDPGWTAFYILRTDDLLNLCAAKFEAATAADESLVTAAPELAALDPLVKRERAEELEQSSDAELICQLQASADRPDPAEVEALRDKMLAEQAAASADVKLGEIDPSFVGLGADAKRARANDVEAEKPELADLLRRSADGMDHRAKALVSLTIHRKGEEAPPSGGTVARLMRGFFRSRKARVAKSTGPRFIPIDGPVDLNYEDPIARLYEGELFGEMSCINYFPRSATVRAAQDCYMIEMLRNVLETLLDNETFKAEMDRVYRERVLANHLRSIPLFADAPDDVLEKLRTQVDLVTKQPGEVIFDEGEPSDSVYVIRIGTVKVYRKAAGGERVLAYRSRGEMIGEMGLIDGEPRNATCAAYEHPRGEKKARSGTPAAYSARIELVRIGVDLFKEICRDYPQFKQQVESVARERADEDTLRDEKITAHYSGRVDALGLMQGQKLMLIDLERCTRCDECVRACVDTHDDGVTRLLREGPRFGKFLIPATCRQCLDPVCMIGCPVGSIHKGATGDIVIEDWCIGCSICAQQCPYEAITMQDVAGKKAVVCDQCSSTNDGVPSCVYACPHDAAIRTDAATFFSEHLTVK